MFDARAFNYLVNLRLRAFGAEEFGDIRLKRKSGRAELEYRALEAVARRRTAARVAQFRKRAPIDFLSSYPVLEISFYIAADVERKRVLRACAHKRGGELFRIKRFLLAVGFCDQYRHT